MDDLLWIVAEGAEHELKAGGGDNLDADLDLDRQEGVSRRSLTVSGTMNPRFLPQ